MEELANKRGAKMTNDGENTNARVANVTPVPLAQLQREIHEALRVQHPDWIEPNGDCPTCESYESRLAELFGLSSPQKLA
jgi:hypothetical protein